MRIAFFVDAFPDLAVTFIINQISGMLARGHEVEIFAQYPGRTDVQHPETREWDLGSRTTYLGPETSKVARVRQVLSSLGRHTHCASKLVRTLPPLAKGTEARSLRYFAAASAFARPRSFDVIHCHFGPNGNTAVLLRKLGLLTGPVVTTFHGYDMRRGESSRGECYRLLREHGDVFLSISGYNRALLEDWGFPSDRIHDHPVGVDPERFAYRGPRPDGSPVRVLTVANLVPVKGHEVLLRALASLRHRVPELDMELRVVGEGPERVSLERTVEECGLGSRVSLLGARDQDGVLAELRRADLFVLPSLAEATPVALMEAQCLGLPVIATRVGSVDEVVAEGKSGLLVQPGDVSSLEDALVTLCRSRSSWATMGEAGRAHVVQNYGIQRLQDDLEGIYYSVSAAMRD